MADKFEITPELIKRRRDKHAEKERLLFFAMCSERDRKLICGEEELTIKDFDRIVYLLDTLGFDNFSWNFMFAHEKIMNEIGVQIESEVNGTGKLNLQEYMETVNQWSREFCDGLPASDMKK